MDKAQSSQKEVDKYQAKFSEAIKYLEKVNKFKRKDDQEDEE